jgi:hypothetical protein
MKKSVSRMGRQLRENTAISLLVFAVGAGLGLSVITSGPSRGPSTAHANDASINTSPAEANVSDNSTTVSTPLVPAVRLHIPARNDISSVHVVTNVGCARSLSAQGLREFFAQSVGPIMGHDEPRTLSLGDGRTLWVLQDTFIDYHYSANSFADMDYVNNTALIQEGLCFTMLEGGTPSHAESFELGDAPMSPERYFWAGGGTVTGGKLLMFWLEFNRGTVPMGPMDGFGFHPVKTWLATYDLKTLKRLSFGPAPNSGVSPAYGYGVADDGEWTYLFGNSDQQDLALEGGYANGPHSATRMYLARVPRGQLASTPSYWDGASWATDAASAAPISSRFFAENLMLPVRIDGHWYSATKVDGFTGDSLVMDIADHPWGPYTTIRSLAATPSGDPKDVVTYHAAVLPWLDPSGGLIVTLSQIPVTGLGPPSAVARYRPNFFVVQP